MFKAFPYSGPVPRYAVSAVESDTQKFMFLVAGDSFAEIEALRDRLVLLLNLYEGVPTDQIKKEPAE